MQQTSSPEPPRRFLHSSAVWPVSVVSRTSTYSEASCTPSAVTIRRSAVRGIRTGIVSMDEMFTGTFFAWGELAASLRESRP